MRVLGVESSCDETAAAVLDGERLLSNVVASQVEEHARYGGVVPEIASRRHLEDIGWVVSEALSRAGVGLADLEGVAATFGPGLVGSLLVGLSYAKALAWSLGLPFVGVNHIEAHMAVLGLEHKAIAHPALALVVSGGHTALYLSREPLRYRLLGQTRDDAVGEAFDKVARLLGLGYPGGPVIDRLARGRDGKAVPLPLVRIGDGSLDFSFSGLKSAVARLVRSGAVKPVPPGEEPGEEVRELLASFQRAAVEALLYNLRRALLDRRPRSLLVAGGVACNSRLRDEAQALARDLGIAAYLPSPALSTDNGAMVAVLGHELLSAGVSHPLDLDADPGLATGRA